MSVPSVAASAGSVCRKQRMYTLLGATRRHIDLQRVSSALCPA